MNALILVALAGLLHPSGSFVSERPDASLIAPVQYTAGMAPCSRYTPHGAPCFCNHGVFRGSGAAAHNPDFYLDERGHSVRKGFHTTYYKGTHSNFCTRD